jgi:uncharacterized protein YjiS (DUF1127 family)
MARWRYRSGRLAARAATIQRSGSMANLVVHDPVQSNDGFRRNEIVKISSIFRRWLWRHRQRKDLGDLAQCNRHLLKDIGISPGEAEREAAKWFWQA